MSPKVELYIRATCPYCIRAMQLLDARDVQYETVDLNHHPERRDEMIERAGGRTTVPQIFIGDHHVGGSDDLFRLEAAGKLDELLAA